MTYLSLFISHLTQLLTILYCNPFESARPFGVDVLLRMSRTDFSSIDYLLLYCVLCYQTVWYSIQSLHDSSNKTFAAWLHQLLSSNINNGDAIWGQLVVFPQLACSKAVSTVQHILKRTFNHIQGGYSCNLLQHKITPGASCPCLCSAAITACIWLLWGRCIICPCSRNLCKR